MITKDEAAFLAGTLRKIRFFATLSVAEVDDIIGRFDKVVYRSGKTIIRQGERGENLFVVYRGGVTVLSKKLFSKTVIAQLGPGDIFGEMSLVDDTPTIATVEAAQAAEVFRLARADFQDAMQRNPELKSAVTKIVDERLFDTHRKGTF